MGNLMDIVLVYNDGKRYEGDFLDDEFEGIEKKNLSGWGNV